MLFEEAVVLPAALEFLRREHLVVVRPRVDREVDLVGEEAVDLLNERVGRRLLRAEQRADVDEVGVVVDVNELLLPDFKLRHEVVVAVLGGRPARWPSAGSLSKKRRQLLVEGEQLVLPQRVELLSF